MKTTTNQIYEIHLQMRSVGSEKEKKIKKERDWHRSITVATQG